MDKIVFLDIDGVLNTQGDKNLIYDTFEINKLNLLVKLLRITEAELVIISDRRLIKEEREMIEKVFDDYEIIVNYLSYKRTHRKRSDEILYFLNNNICNKYIILDDNDLGYSENNIISKHFINTYNNGFGYDEYVKGIELLK